jgi:ribosome-binding protein aMBF1 (putative translation factor)
MTRTDETLGQQIRRRREALELTRVQLSQRLTPVVDPQTIYEWETDRYLPEEGRRANLAEVLGGTYQAPRFVFPKLQQKG